MKVYVVEEERFKQEIVGVAFSLEDAQKKALEFIDYEEELEWTKESGGKWTTGRTCFNELIITEFVEWHENK